MTCIKAALREAAARLTAVADGNAALEARILLAETLEKPATYLMAWPEQELSPQQQQLFQEQLGRRLAGEPIAYLLGRREFWSLRLKVNKDVLIPRPETERLVELALDAFAPESRIHVADLGVGSGAIAAAIAKERPHWSIVATDRSGSALRLAEENFRANGLSNIQTRAGDWCAALPPKSAFEMIVSNPPYVAASDPHLQQGDVRYEPPSALTAGPEGMDDLRRIVRQAPKHLKPAGLLFLEHGYNQGQAVRELLQENGFADIETYQDLAGQERVSRGRLGAS